MLYHQENYYTKPRPCTNFKTKCLMQQKKDKAEAFLALKRTVKFSDSLPLETQGKQNKIGEPRVR